MAEHWEGDLIIGGHAPRRVARSRERIGGEGFLWARLPGR